MTRIDYSSRRDGESRENGNENKYVNELRQDANVSRARKALGSSAWELLFQQLCAFSTVTERPMAIVPGSAQLGSRP